MEETIKILLVSLMSFMFGGTAGALLTTLIVSGDREDDMYGQK